MTNSLQELCKRLTEKIFPKQQSEYPLAKICISVEELHLLVSTCQRVLDAGKEIKKFNKSEKNNPHYLGYIEGFNACHDLFTALIAKEYVRKEDVKEQTWKEDVKEQTRNKKKLRRIINNSYAHTDNL